MNKGFSRTPTGIVGSRYFFPEPIVWVEGPTDIYFYEPILGDKKCILKPFHGHENAIALIDGLTMHTREYPYAVILDGDYNILNPRRSYHRWIITLKRYSFENYLWEGPSLNQSCLRHGQRGDKIDVVESEYKRLDFHIHSALRELVELDVAARRCATSPKVLPDRIEPLLVRPDKPEICSVKVQAVIDRIHSKGEIPEEILKNARDDVSNYLKTNRLSFLLNGHLLLGIIRRIFTQVTTRLRGSKSIINDDGLLQLLSEMVWRRPPSPDHKNLRKKLVRVVRELNTSRT